MDGANFSSYKVQIYFKNLSHYPAYAGTGWHQFTIRFAWHIRKGTYKKLLRARLHRQHHPKTPKIVNRFGNHKRALRTTESELVWITPAATPFLAERFFTGGGVCRIRFFVPDGTPLHDVAALVPGAVAGDPFRIGVHRSNRIRAPVVAVPAVVFIPPISPWVDISFRSTCRLFPLGFCGQTASRPPGVSLRVVPVDQHNRVIVELGGTAIFVPDRKRVDPCADVRRPMTRCLHKSPVLAIGDGINRDVERIESDAALRTLLIEVVSHSETACGNKHHRGAVLFVDDDRRQLAAGWTERESSEFRKDFVICWCIHRALLSPVFYDAAKAFRSSEALRACPFLTIILNCSICS